MFRILWDSSLETNGSLLLAWDLSNISFVLGLGVAGKLPGMLSPQAPECFWQYCCFGSFYTPHTLLSLLLLYYSKIASRLIDHSALRGSKRKNSTFIYGTCWVHIYDGWVHNYDINPRWKFQTICICICDAQGGVCQGWGSWAGLGWARVDNHW